MRASDSRRRAFFFFFFGNTVADFLFSADGQYYLDAGAVCLPGFWRLREKFGLSLDELHFEANVPHYEQKLRKSMNRFFKSMTPEKAVIRNNVGGIS